VKEKNVEQRKEKFFFCSYRYSSLPLPGPRPLPPQAWILTALYGWFQRCIGTFRGRTQLAAPVNPPMNGIGRGSTLAISHLLAGLHLESGQGPGIERTI